MRDKFTVDFDRVAQAVLPKRAFRLADVEHRLERVAYDLVRFRDNEDTDQLWKVQESPDGPVIVALYGEDGSLITESNDKKKGDWEAIPDKKALHIYYKGEPLVSLGSTDIGVPAEEFSLVRRWLPAKLAADESLQTELFGKVSAPVRKLIAQRFPELTKVAGYWEDEGDELEGEAEGEPAEEGEWNFDDEENVDILDPFRPGGRTGLPMAGEFDERLMPEEDMDEDEEAPDRSMFMEVLKALDDGKISKEKAVEIISNMTKAASLKRFAAPTGRLDNFGVYVVDKPDEDVIYGDVLEPEEVEDFSVDWNPDDLTSDEIIDDDPPNWLRDKGPMAGSGIGRGDKESFEQRLMLGDEADEDEEEGVNAESEVLDLINKFKEGKLTREEVEASLFEMVGKPDIFSKSAAINGLYRIAEYDEEYDESEEYEYDASEYEYDEEQELADQQEIIDALNDPNTPFDDFYEIIVANYSSNPEDYSLLSKRQIVEAIKNRNISKDELEKIKMFFDSRYDQAIREVVGPLEG